MAALGQGQGRSRWSDIQDLPPLPPDHVERGPGCLPSALSRLSLGRQALLACSGEREKCTDCFPLLLVFQSKKDSSLWMCPFHPPLHLFFGIRNTRLLRAFGLAKIKVWNYWTADGVSTRP